MDTINKNISFKLIYTAIGILAGLMLVLLPLKYAVLAVLGGGFLIFAFFNLELAMMLFLGVMAIAPHEMWNNMYIALGAVLFAGIYTIHYFLGKRDKIDLKYIAPSLMVYLLFCGISLYTGFGKMDSIRVFVILFGCVIISTLLTNVINTKKLLQDFICIMTIAITISALYGLYRYSMGVEIKAEFVDLTQNQGLKRLVSVTGNSNNDAEFWTMIMPFSIGLIFATKCDVKRTVLIAMVLICFAALLLTSSRAGYIALLAAAGVFIVLTAPRLVPVCLLLGLLMIPFIPQSIINRLSTVGKDTSSTYRILIWKNAIEMAKGYWSQGVGMGPGAFVTIYKEYLSNSASNAMHAHNVLLNTWIEIGIGGVIALIIYMFNVLKTGISTFYTSLDKKLKFFTAAGVASLTGFFVFSMVEYVWFYPRVMLCFWIVCGLIFAMARINDLENTKSLQS